jgi:TonB family protein
MTVTDGGQPRRIDVPVELPEGMSREGVFGEEGDQLFGQKSKNNPFNRLDLQTRLKRAPKAHAQYAGGGAPPLPPSKPIPGSAPIPREESSVIAFNRITVSGGVLQGSATKKVQPAYPPIAQGARVKGAVQIQITVSESGEVINAQAIGGHPLLRDAALQAAKKWRFKPTELSGVPVKTQGVITFNFDSGNNHATDEPVPITPLTEEQFKQQLRAKLHPAVIAVIERLKNKGAKPGAEELKFTRDGKAEIQIRLSDKSAETIEQLKKLGFETILDPQSSKLIIGRLPIEKLAALAELPAVRYISPQIK